ncbi:hypothetical protein ACFLX2_00420 [Candidatus Dependentiae bacterium]
MKSITLTYCPTSSGVPLQEVEQLGQRLKPEIERTKEAQGQEYATDYASLHLSADQQMIEGVIKLIAQKRADLNPTMLVVVGIGGSSLGTIAVHEARNGLFYNQTSQKTKIYFVDTVDADYTRSVLALAQQEFEKGDSVLVNVVTKSGTTTETVVNAQLFLQLLQKHRPKDFRDRIVVTTDRDSKLWQYAQQEQLDALEIPKKVGGRYSVFSPVGLFPLGFVGIDIKELLRGAQRMVEEGIAQDVMKNPAALSAAVVYGQLKKGSTIHDTFIFSRQMRAVGDWYRQLVGESLGKRTDRDGKVVYAGITPTTSIGTNDLHSVAQLYLGGPRDKFATFVTVGSQDEKLAVPHFEQFDAMVPYVQGKTVASIMDAIAHGVRRAYRADDRPFISIALPQRSAFYLGQFLQMKMLEVIYLGFLMNVNPFDQPAVERYKKETRKILASE